MKVNSYTVKACFTISTSNYFIKTLFILILLVLFLLHGKTYGQEKTGANDVNTNKVSSETLSVWAAPAEKKIRPDDRIESENLIWSDAKKKITVAGAGNEHVPFQVVITNPIPPGRKPVAPGGFFIKSSGLKNKDGKTISEARVSFYLEHYIMLYGKSGPIGATGLWPDALAPVVEPFNMATQYSVVRNRPVWVDISIPTSTPAGIYTGTITVTKDDKTVSTINLELQVYNFSLPDTTHLVTYMNVSKS